jgi:hypothetical protein
MCSKQGSLSVVLPVLLLLFWSGCALAFSFCFSFGGRDSQRARYQDFPPPLPGGMPGLYGGYPYSPVPVYPGYSGYYSLPYGMPAAKPAQDAADQGTYRE